MVNLQSGFRPKAYAAAQTAMSFRSQDHRLSRNSLLANRLQLTVHPVHVPLGTCVSGLAVVDTALPLAVTSGTVFERLSDDVLPGITLSQAL
jgi:hypothetical protein